MGVSADANSEKRSPTDGALEPDFPSVYRTHFAAVCGWVRALGLSADEARDTAQETFLIVHRRLHELDPGAPVRPWLFGIARRVASTYRRGQGRRRSREEKAPAVPDACEAPDAWIQRREAVESVETFLDTLETSRRLVFLMAEVDGMSTPDIAVALELPLATVRSRLRAARGSFQRFVHRLRTRERREARHEAALGTRES